MTKVILPIHSKFVQKIITGEKKCEFRKKIFKKPIDSVLIYECAPVSKIIGEFKIKEIISGCLDDVWEKTNEYAGTNKESLINYLGDSDVIHALVIEELVIYQQPICAIKDLMKSVPQSFIYVD